jgi:hypothetical protein
MVLRQPCTNHQSYMQMQVYCSFSKTAEGKKSNENYNLHNRTMGVDKQFPFTILLLPIDIECNQQSYNRYNSGINHS